MGFFKDMYEMGLCSQETMEEQEAFDRERFGE